MGNTVGKFSSPELFDVTDTITVNSIPIRADELEAIYGVLSPLCEQTKIKTGKAPSQFEINFVAALIHFVRSECSYAVLECGMGGVGDATNAICDSIVSVITPISLDHQAYLVLSDPLAGQRIYKSLIFNEIPKRFGALESIRYSDRSRHTWNVD